MSGQIKSMPATALPNCKHCKKAYILQPSGSEFCSRRCYLNYRSLLARAANTHTCKHCGKSFYRCPSQLHGGFCSMKCFGMAKTLPSTVTCPICGGKKAWGGARCRNCYGLSKRTGQEHPCGNCGKMTYRSPAQLSGSPRTYGVFCSKRCAGLAIRGEKNAYFEHGRMAALYPPEFPAIKPRILKRDGRKCLLCGAHSGLHVHHIDRDRENNDPSNLATLCRDCHSAQHRHRISAEGATELAMLLSRLLSDAYGYPTRSIILRSRKPTTILPMAS